MADSFTAQIKNWSDRAKRNADLVVKQSITDVVAEMTTKTGSNSKKPKHAVEGVAPFEIGKVPVDTGFLVNSLVAELNGSTVGQGQDSYILAVAGMKLGDTVTAAFTAEYALDVEYGNSKMQGRYFVREAVLKWQSIVDQNAKKLAD